MRCDRSSFQWYLVICGVFGAAYLGTGVVMLFVVFFPFGIFLIPYGAILITCVWFAYKKNRAAEKRQQLFRQYSFRKRDLGPDPDQTDGAFHFHF